MNYHDERMTLREWREERMYQARTNLQYGFFEHDKPMSWLNEAKSFLGIEHARPLNNDLFFNHSSSWESRDETLDSPRDFRDLYTPTYLQHDDSFSRNYFPYPLQDEIQLESTQSNPSQINEELDKLTSMMEVMMRMMKDQGKKIGNIEQEMTDFKQEIVTSNQQIENLEVFICDLRIELDKLKLENKRNEEIPPQMEEYDESSVGEYEEISSNHENSEFSNTLINEDITSDNEDLETQIHEQELSKGENVSTPNLNITNKNFDTSNEIISLSFVEVSKRRTNFDELTPLTTPLQQDPISHGGALSKDRDVTNLFSKNDKTTITHDKPEDFSTFLASKTKSPLKGGRKSAIHDSTTHHLDFG